MFFLCSSTSLNSRSPFEVLIGMPFVPIRFPSLGDGETNIKPNDRWLGGKPTTATVGCERHTHGTRLGCSTRMPSILSPSMAPRSLLQISKFTRNQSELWFARSRSPGTHGRDGGRSIGHVGRFAGLEQSADFPPGREMAESDGENPLEGRPVAAHQSSGSTFDLRIRWNEFLHRVG